MDLKEKASYILGLLEGTKIDVDGGEDIVVNGKILKSIVSLLQEVCEKVQEIDEVCSENSALIDELDEDLANVEKDFYKKGFDCGKNFEKGSCSCGSDENFHRDDFSQEAEYEVSCPNCKRVVELTDDIFDKDDVICPECGEKIDFDLKNFEEEI